MKQSVDHILTTHVGSLPRPRDLLDLMNAKVTGLAYDKGVYDQRVKSAVAECVRRQVESGIDIVSDGEQSKPGFFTYVHERLEGFEERPQQKRRMFPDEVAAFAEYYEKYFKEAMTRGAIRSNRAAGLHRPGQISRRGGARVRHRKSPGHGGRGARSRRLRAGGSAERRRNERVLPD